MDLGKVAAVATVFGYDVRAAFGDYPADMDPLDRQSAPLSDELENTAGSACLGGALSKENLAQRLEVATKCAVKTQERILKAILEESIAAANGDKIAEAINLFQISRLHRGRSLLDWA